MKTRPDSGKLGSWVGPSLRSISAHDSSDLGALIIVGCVRGLCKKDISMAQRLGVWLG